MRLIIVGTLQGHITEAGRIAHQRGAQVVHAETTDQALQALRAGKGADLAMVDVESDIAGFILALERERIALPVVACGIGSDARAAVKAIRSGAKEYVPLPPDAEMIAAVLAAVTEDDRTMIGSDPAMQAVKQLAERVAASDATVLITGPSGTGKEVMARFVHGQSSRKDKVFVSVNCAAIPENLLESELFGHEKGAFTGALARRVGKFEEANGGTLLLDEISEMDIRLQAKLLRAIQEREIDRVGGTKPVKVDIRLIATSNRDLTEAVREGSFREDLYYRLNVVNLALPALKDRPRDMEALTTHFVAKFSEQNSIPVRPVSDAAMAMLKSHNWPGNIRELENTLHRAVLVAGGDEIGPEAIILQGSIASPSAAADPAGPAPQTAPSRATMPGAQHGTVEVEDRPWFGNAAATTSPAAGASSGAPAAHGAAPAGQTEEHAALVGRTVAEVERDLILNTLDHCLGNRTHAANILGISIRTLRNKLKQYSEDGVEVPPAGSAEPAELAGA